jgi:hypothetical protein
MAATPNDASILNDPTWFLADIDASRGAFRFVRASRDELSRTPFLDGRWKGGNERTELSFQAGAALPRSSSAPRFIWHTAFCASTLLASVLDVPGTNLSLKEPNALVTLSNMKRTKGRDFQDKNRWREVVRCTVGLLGRQFSPSETITIKPTNLCNNLLPDVVDAHEQLKSLLLYSDLREFISSIAVKSEHGRNFVRRLFTALLMDSNFVEGQSAQALLQLTDLQIATMVWLMQIRAYREILARIPANRIATMPMKSFVEDPKTAIERLSGFFDLRIDQGMAASIAKGPLFKIDAKNPSESFDPAKRQDKTHEMEATFGKEFDLLTKWAATQWPDLASGPPTQKALMS